VIVVGTARRRGRRGVDGQLGYNVKAFCYQDSRRAHSIAAQVASPLEELPERRRFCLALVLRHGQGRRLRAREANVYFTELS
jgi:succinate dehydrogenase / fumarate reductase flavoprotein subunit